MHSDLCKRADPIRANEHMQREREREREKVGKREVGERQIAINRRIFPSSFTSCPTIYVKVFCAAGLQTWAHTHTLSHTRTHIYTHRERHTHTHTHTHRDKDTTSTDSGRLLLHHSSRCSGAISSPSSDICANPAGVANAAPSIRCSSGSRVIRQK